MAIPHFDPITLTLPPHQGTPTDPTLISPYRCTIEELCSTFGNTPDRKRILNGFLDFRKELYNEGIRGFHWIDGSFMEEIETLENRPPGDIDVVSFIDEPVKRIDFEHLMASNPHWWKEVESKRKFYVHNFMIHSSFTFEEIVSQVGYWYGLFSHQRDKTWKGMLRIELVDIRDDGNGRKVLGALP